MLTIHPIFLLRIITEALLFIGIVEIFMWGRFFSLLTKFLESVDTDGPNS